MTPIESLQKMLDDVNTEIQNTEGYISRGTTQVNANKISLDKLQGIKKLYEEAITKLETT